MAKSDASVLGQAAKIEIGKLSIPAFAIFDFENLTREIKSLINFHVILNWMTITQYLKLNSMSQEYCTIVGDGSYQNQVETRVKQVIVKIDRSRDLSSDSSLCSS